MPSFALRTGDAAVVCLCVCVFVCLCAAVASGAHGQAGSAAAAVGNFGADLRDCRALAALLEVSRRASQRHAD